MIYLIIFKAANLNIKSLIGATANRVVGIELLTSRICGDFPSSYTNIPVMRLTTCTWTIKVEMLCKSTSCVCTFARVYSFFSLFHRIVFFSLSFSGLFYKEYKSRHTMHTHTNRIQMTIVRNMSFWNPFSLPLYCRSNEIHCVYLCRGICAYACMYVVRITQYIFKGAHIRHISTTIQK